MKFGVSGIELVVAKFIYSILNKGDTVVELGSGYTSTQFLSKFYNLYSVEQSLEYVGLYPKSKYLYAPIENGWYELKTLPLLLPKSIDLLLVDGPMGEGNRYGILDHIDLFNPSQIIVHDTYRESALEVAAGLTEKLNKTCVLYDQGDHWAYIS